MPRGIVGLSLEDKTMRIVRTQVGQATAASSGEPILRVQFCGEGGECVRVDMADPDRIAKENALNLAKAILVQTATFNQAANDYDAQSNGNFDEVAVTSVQEGENKTYIFEYRDGEGIRRVPPSVMPSFQAAREEAIRGAIDLLDGLQPDTVDLSGWLVRVRDENGELLCIIDGRAAEEARRAGDDAGRTGH
ncbi:DUF6894 family protein [Mesorhizobium koreense]|jgi:hypothetical protein|uniref:DUF6894 family protein n=1 Tax=Mesorhizobium koreense TaxID=3074855 RepID=UPI00287B64E8|nr:hypothetical protein [Mesorhizobium sp. WR6]